MPDDLLRYITGPAAYPSGWMWLAVSLLLAVVLWYAAVFTATVPGRRLGDMAGLKTIRGDLIRRRAVRAIQTIGRQYRAGDLTRAAAGEAVSTELRSFLQRISGLRAEYMQLDAIAGSQLAPAAPLLAELIDAQFNAGSTVDMASVCESAEELIDTWT